MIAGVQISHPLDPELFVRLLMETVDAADAMRSWYDKQMGPDGPEEHYDALRERVEQTTNWRELKTAIVYVGGDATGQQAPTGKFEQPAQLHMRGSGAEQDLVIPDADVVAGPTLIVGAATDVRRTECKRCMWLRALTVEGLSPQDACKSDQAPATHDVTCPIAWELDDAIARGIATGKEALLQECRDCGAQRQFHLMSSACGGFRP